jgi:hypothetical protein
MESRYRVADFIKRLSICLEIALDLDRILMLQRRLKARCLAAATNDNRQEGSQ